MAAAGTLSRPTSAQSNYGPFQNYYPPSSPTISSTSTYARPASASGNYANDNYSTYRKPVSARPTTPRHSTSTHHIPTSTPNSPTRIYGSRKLSKSSEDVQRLGRLTVPIQQTLHRNYTAPDLRHRANTQQASPSSSTRNSASLSTRNSGKPVENGSNTTRMGIVDKSSSGLELRTGESTNGSSSSPSKPNPSSILLHSANLELDQSSVPSHHTTVKGQSEHDRYNLPRPQNSSVEEEILPAEPSPATELVSDNSDRLDHSAGVRIDSLATSEEVPRRQNRQAVTPEVYISNSSPDRDPKQHLTVVPSIITEFQTNHRQEQSSPSRQNLPPRSNTPVPANYTTREKSRSLKDRLRRALSLSSGGDLDQMAHLEVPATRKSRDGRGLFALNNKSTDNISISSTASSASMMLRKMGHGLSKKTKRSLNGIFSGSRTKLGDDMSTNGTTANISPVVGDISYVNVESQQPDRETSTHFRTASIGQSPAHYSISSLRSKSNSPVKAEITEAASNVDGHGSVAFPRLSEEITVDEDRSRRASMHLERPLPIDLAENFSSARSFPSTGRRGTPIPVSASASATPIVSAYTGKGILKKTEDTFQSRAPLVAHNALPPLKDSTSRIIDDRNGTSDFDISFAPTPTLDLGQFATPDEISTPGLSPSPSVPESPAMTFPGAAGGSKGTSPQSLTFCPRITIHETYTAMEYDRRGEIATCNRLTPLLAQRIKEELNAYKMDEMDVAEESRVHTHFFT